MSLSNSFPQGSGNSRRGDRKTVRALCGGWLQPTDTTGLVHAWTHRDHDSACQEDLLSFKSNKTNPRTKKGKWTQSPAPNQEASHNWCFLGGKQSASFKEVPLGQSTTLQGRPHAQVNTDSMLSFVLFDVLCGLFWYFLVIFLFWFSLGEVLRESKIGSWEHGVVRSL